MCIELYPHNQRTYETIMEMWQKDNKVVAIQPTGTGKSFLILKCIEYVEGNKIVLAPSNYILEQLVKQNSKLLENTTLMTYATLQNLTEDQLQALNVSLIVLDEFHRCGAEQWGGGVKRLLEVYQNTKVLGTSATPIRFLDNARDMSDELFDGHIACNMTLPQAIVEGILSMPKYVSALYTFEEEANNIIEKVNKSKNSDEEKKEIIKDIKKLKTKLDRSHGIPNILEKYITNPSGKYIVFCRNQEHLNEMKDTVIGWFKNYFKSNDILNNIISYEVYSDLEDSDEQLESFITNNSENTLKLLFSINKLNEGLHIKDADGVILLRPTTSPIIYYQQIGRVIDAGRKGEQTLILDFVNNFSSIRTNTLKDDLEETAREFYGRGEATDTNEKEFVDKFRVYDETYDIVNLFSEIDNRLCASWDLIILSIEQFTKKYGHCNIPYNHIEIVNENIINLGFICSQIRSAFTHKNNKNTFKLTSERIIELQKYNFAFELRNQYNDFDECFLLLLNYYNEHGNTNININYTCNNIKLGIFVSNLRSRYRRNLLSNYEIEKLKTIEFTFEPYDKKWEYNYKLLSEYYYECSNMNIKRGCVYRGVNLFILVNNIRSKYKKKKLTNDRVEQLEAINFIFEVGLKNHISKVICLELKEVFNSIKEARIKYSISKISECCSGLKKSAGKHPETGEPLHWMYYDEYLELHPEEAENLKEAI